MTTESIADLDCAKCHARSTKVVDSRGANKLGTSIRRRRQCLKCGFRFTTYETAETPQQMMKRIALARRAFTALQDALRDLTAEEAEES